MAKDRDETDTYTLDDVSRGILYELQLDARNTTHEEISEKVGVSSSTVRNRITRLEAAGIIETYVPELNYERAGFPLRVQFICTAAPDLRSQCAQEAIELDGVIRIDETITSVRNLTIQVVALDTQILAEVTQHLTELELEIHSSEIVTTTYTKPFTHFEHAEERAQSHSRTRSQSHQEESSEADAE